MTPSPAQVLVLAGSRGNADPLARYAGVPHKSLIPIDGEPMLDRVIGVLRCLPGAPRIALALDHQDLLDRLPGTCAALESGQLCLVPTADSPSRTVLAALRQRNLPMPFLLTTADHPLLTPEMISHFWRHVPAGVDLAAAVAPMARSEAWPLTQRTRLRFSDGAYSGCNLYAVMTMGAEMAIDFWQQAEARRKRPAALIRLLGLGVAARYLTGNLSLSEAIAHLERRTQTRLAAIPVPFPEAAIDVDKLDDLILAQRILRARRLGTSAALAPADIAT